MERTLVTGSSRIASWGYEDGILEVEFTSPPGAVYEYYQVQPFVWDILRTAESPGKAFDINIKGRYEFKRTT